MLRRPWRLSIALVVVLASSCGGDDPGAQSPDAETPTPADAESDESPESPSPEVEETLPPGIAATTQGLLRAGSYQTSVFEPLATFIVPRGWRIPFEEGDNIIIARKVEPRDEVIYIDSSQRGLDTGAALDFAKDTFIGTTGVARDFRFSREEEASIGGYRGLSVTMDLRTDQPVVTLGLGTEAYEVRPGDRLQLNAISIDAEAILVFVEAPGPRFGAFLDEAGPVLDSLRF